MACQDGIMVDCDELLSHRAGKPKQFTPEEEQKFLAADNLFRGVMISALYPKYEKNYISCTSCKELRGALETKFGVSDAGSELFLMEQLYDYKIVETVRTGS